MMMRPTSIFALAAAAMTFAAGGASIVADVTVQVDRHIESVSLEPQLGPFSRESSTSTRMRFDTQFTAKAESDFGYTANWEVLTNGVFAFGGEGIENTITIPSTKNNGFLAYSGCTLSFYADPNTYRVSLNRLSGSGGDAYVDVTYDAAMPSATKPTRTGYTFGGYYTEENGGGIPYYDADGSSARNWDISSNATLYAKWTANEYTVTLDPQPGSGGTASVTATFGAELPSIGVPTRAGFSFGGYFANSGGSGTQYYDATGVGVRTWDIATGKTLYAKWTANAYTITLDKQDGSGGTDSVSATYGSSLSRIEKPTRGGYKFLGYYAAQAGNGKQYYNASGNAVSSSDFTSNTTIYAYWTPNPTVTLVIYDGSFLNGWTSSTNYEEGVGLVLPGDSDVAYANHAFIGWYGDESFLTDRVTSIPSTATGNRTFYARWEGKTYNVQFDPNGGEGRGEQKLSMTNSDQLKPLAELRISAPAGYTFKEWNTVVGGSGDSFPDGAVIHNNLTNVANATVTLYAQWTPNSYEVAFHPNGADGGEMANQSFVYGTTQNLHAVEFTYTGHAFERWSSNTNYNSQTKYYTNCAEVANLATEGVATLYANWTGIVYTVTFDANGAVGTMDPLLCTYDMPTNLPLCTFSRNGWGFNGWAVNGAEDKLFADGARVTNLTATAGGEVSLVACWTGVTYAVTLDARDWRSDGMMTNRTGETVSVLTNLYTVGDDWVLPVPTSAKPHLAFVGWRDNWGQMVGDGALVPPDSEGVTNLVAVWSDSLSAAVDAPELGFGTFGTVGVFGRPTEGRYNADWFVQANFVQGSASAVQSGALPVNTGDDLLYVSWLTTKVEGKGVLTFWWKCDAQQLVEDPNQEATGGRAGDIFRFGLYDSAKGISTNENEFVELTGTNDWCYVAFTNKSDEAVSFAWAFIYADYGHGNGGGTGWVDRVTWTPEGSVGKLSFISISGDGHVVSGGSATYACTAMMSDGSMKSVTPTWSIESGASYADLDSAGVFTARATDTLRTVTVRATYTEGDVTATATKTVTIAPLDTYTIIFDSNGGSGTMGSLACIYDVATNLPACTFMRDGWGFAGWATNRTDGVLFADGARVSNLATEGTVALYACWTGITYAVSLDANGGVLTNGSGESVDELDISVIVGGTWNLPVPTNADTSFVFEGWTYGEGQKVSSGTEVPPPSAGITRLVATWSKADPLAIAVDAPELGFETFGTIGTHGHPNEDRSNADWFVQENFVHGSASAVQSGALPVNTEDSYLYVSWLTTKVEGKGVLSFWWKCDAKPLEDDPGQQATGGRVGNIFQFGLYDSTVGITNEVAELTGTNDWCYVAFTNETESTVSFAWAFVYADYGYNNGGGTGWVDRVTWTPEGAVAEVTSAHGVPHGWLREKFSLASSASSAELEATAEANSPNGKAWPDGTSVKVWQEYWAGTEPSNPNDLFRVLIAVTNGEPTITWQPNLSEATPPRVYRVLCAPTPTAGMAEWVEWPGPGTEGPATNGFFKVELDWARSRQE